MFSFASASRSLSLSLLISDGNNGGIYISALLLSPYIYIDKFMAIHEMVAGNRFSLRYNALTARQADSYTDVHRGRTIDRWTWRYT